MKKYITIAALLAAGSALASANGTKINTDGWDTLEYKLRTSSDTIVSQTNLNSGRAGFAELSLDGITLPGISGADYSWSVSFKLAATPTNLPTTGDLLFSMAKGNNGSGLCIGLDRISEGSYTFALRHGIPTEVYKDKDLITTLEGSLSDTLSFTWDAATKILYFGVGDQSYVHQLSSPLSITLSTTSNSAAATGTTFWTNGGREKLTDITVKAHAIPEPSTFGLLAGIGALALVGTRRRKRA
ncbi:MAG: PEP-CTERM sorting domain-containing protein [Opitutales bacterium]|nr:PEP-CTERM sorting domain-containing protein [Opitutales bacterium]